MICLKLCVCVCEVESQEKHGSITDIWGYIGERRMLTL